jgi:hypothetical protein
VYRLDCQSGEVMVIEKGISSKVTEMTKTSNLIIGSFYMTEDSVVLRYLGNGKFEPRKSLDEIFKK